MRDSGHWAGTPKRRLNLGRNCFNTALACSTSGCSREPQFRDQPVLEGSRRSLHPPLFLRRQGEYHLSLQLCHCAPELGGRAGGLIFRLVLEDGVAVGVQGEGYAEAPEQALHQQEVTAGCSHDRRTGR